MSRDAYITSARRICLCYGGHRKEIRQDSGKELWVLAAEDDVEARQYTFNVGARQVANPLLKEGAIDGYYLRDIRGRIP